MRDETIRENIAFYAEDYDTTIFDNPDFDNSIIGMTGDGRIVYDYDLMVEEYVKDNNCSYEDAVEFIDVNTMRTIPYMGEQSPIIIEISRERLVET